MTKRLRVLVTGANGFVGKNLIRQCDIRNKYKCTGAARTYPLRGEVSDNIVYGHELKSSSNWSDLVSEHQVVAHCAARAHVMKDEAVNPLSLYREVNTAGTLNLARQAAAVGVRRFIFISSIKVNGEQTEVNQLFTSDADVAPEDPYGISKMEAEQGLKDLAAETGMEVVIIRPPLVYGPGVKGNFASMIKLVEKGMPLPLGAIHNKRSLVALDNLIDLIITCIDHPAAANQTFLVSDGEDLSTTELLRGVAEAMGRPSRLIPVPAGLLRLGATLLGKKAVAQRLLGSLQVDISHTQECLGWKPPLTVKQGLKRCFETDQDE